MFTLQANICTDQTAGTIRSFDSRWTPTQGNFPRNFNFDPSGAFLFAENQNSGTVVVFRVDPKSGDLTPTGQVLSVPRPACLRWVKAAS